jgi:hypothetical protein
MVEAAIVRLQARGSAAQRTTLTDQTGSFHFSAVEPGPYTLTITAGGFTDEKTNVLVASGENPPLPAVVLQIAPAVSAVDVTLPPHELAVQQVHAEEKQRLLGIVPNFYVTYDPNAAPHEPCLCRSGGAVEPLRARYALVPPRPGDWRGRKYGI